MRSLQRRRPGELPPSGALGLVASQDSERCQAVEDLLDVALVRAPERASDLLHRPGGRGLGGEVAERQIWSASFFVHGAAAAGCEAACSGSSVAKSRSRVAALNPGAASGRCRASPRLRIRRSAPLGTNVLSSQNRHLCGAAQFEILSPASFDVITSAEIPAFVGTSPCGELNHISRFQARGLEFDRVIEPKMIGNFVPIFHTNVLE
jgi:hypothetical protein